MAADYLDLKSLQAMIKEGLEDLFPEKFWVKAEIGQWSPRANGHCYLSLQQSDGKGVVAEMKAMIWKWNVLPLTAFFEEGTGSPLRSGITVLVKVEVNYNPIYGISLFIDDIDPSFTLGEQALERKRTMERLEKEGLTLLQKELCLPDIPYRLAVVSSRTAAGFHREFTAPAFFHRGQRPPHRLPNQALVTKVLSTRRTVVQPTRSGTAMSRMVPRAWSRACMVSGSTWAVRGRS